MEVAALRLHGVSVIVVPAPLSGAFGAAISTDLEICPDLA